MTSSSVVATAPLTRISAAAPSMIRCRVAAPFGVSFLTSGPAVIAELLDSWVQTLPLRGCPSGQGLATAPEAAA